MTKIPKWWVKNWSLDNTGPENGQADILATTCFLMVPTDRHHSLYGPEAASLQF